MLASFQHLAVGFDKWLCMCNYPFSRASNLLTLKHFSWSCFPAKSFPFFFFPPRYFIFRAVEKISVLGRCFLGLLGFVLLGFFHSLPSQEGLNYFIFCSCLLLSSDWSWEHQPESENLTTVSRKEIQCVCVCAGCKRCAFFNLGGVCCNSPTAKTRNWKLSSIVLLWFQNWIWKSSIF